MSLEDTNSGAGRKRPPSRMRPMMLGAAMAMALGAGGFYAVWSGLVLPASPEGQDARAAAPPADSVARSERPEAPIFVSLDPLVVSLGSNAGSRHLRFKAELEVLRGREAEVRALTPRIADTLNGYLRAVTVAELEDPASLFLLRAQMLRRIQIITGDDMVRDLLVTEFVLS